MSDTSNNPPSSGTPPAGSTPKSTPRRFIAGAKCPACGLEDKIVMYRIDDQKFYECVKCGHKEAEAKPEAVKPTSAVKDAPAPLEQVLHFHPAPKKP